MDEVILARHGESELSVVGIVNGDPAVACALTAALAGRAVPRLVLPELNDVRFGSFEGGTLTDYRKWAAANEPTVEAPGGGESRSGTVARYVSAYRTILSSPERTVLVVAHGLPIRYVLNELEKTDPTPLVEQVAYAEPYRLPREELERAVDRLEGWAAQPGMASGVGRPVFRPPLVQAVAFKRSP